MKNSFMPFKSFDYPVVVVNGEAFARVDGQTFALWSIIGESAEDRAKALCRKHLITIDVARQVVKDSGYLTIK